MSKMETKASNHSWKNPGQSFEPMSCRSALLRRRFFIDNFEVEGNIIFVTHTHMKKVPLPPGLRLRDDFRKGELWYIASTISGLSVVEITNTSREVVFYTNEKNESSSLPIGSSLFIHPHELRWLSDIIRKRVMIQGVSRTNQEIFSEISTRARKGDSPDDCLFIDWMHRVQRQFARVITDTLALSAAIERLLVEVRKH